MTVTSKSLPALLSSAIYTFRGGFLVRPFIIALTLGDAGAVISWLEEDVPAIGSLVPGILFPSHSDPQVAQAILTDIATSIMTVVSIVFAILLMTLTLASTQFSPRILISFIRDRVTQWTLGIFLGTFSYCIAALPAARSAPHAFVPVATPLSRARIMRAREGGEVQWPADQVERWPIGRLISHAKNSRTHSKARILRQA